MTLVKVSSFLLLFTSSSVFGQVSLNKYEAKLGYGLYQGFNIGINYYYGENLNLGVGFGTHFNLPPLNTPYHFNISIEHNFHFGKINTQEIKPWILNQQLMYWELGPSTYRRRIISLGLPNIGRIFVITKHLGLYFEIGSAINFVVDLDQDDLQAGPHDFIWPVFYNARAQMVYLF